MARGYFTDWNYGNRNNGGYFNNGGSQGPFMMPQGMSFPRYGNQPYQQRQSFGRSQNVVKKHSGCRVKTMEDGSKIVTGWNYSKSRGMIKLYARPYSKTLGTTSKSGKRWLNLFVTLTDQRTLQTTKTSGMFCVDNNKLYIKEFNMVANPGAPNGGYFGKHVSKR